MWHVIKYLISVFLFATLRLIIVLLQKKGGDAPPADLEAASLEELHQKILTLEKEKNKEEEYRNYMQLERVLGLLRSLTVQCALSSLHPMARPAG